MCAELLEELELGFYDKVLKSSIVSSERETDDAIKALGKEGYILCAMQEFREQKHWKLIFLPVGMLYMGTA